MLLCIHVSKFHAQIISNGGASLVKAVLFARVEVIPHECDRKYWVRSVNARVCRGTCSVVVDEGARTYIYILTYVSTYRCTLL